MAQIYKLTALQIKNAKPKEKEYSLNDGRGLYVRIYTNGTKSFYLQQLINGKRVRCNLGLVGEMSLENARNIAEQKIAQTKLTPAEYGKIITFKDAMIEYLEYKNVDAIDFFNEDYSGDDISIFRSYSGYIY